MDLYKDRGIQETVKKQKTQIAVYSIEDFEGTLCVAQGLMDNGYVGESSLYCDEEKRRYYIFLEDALSKDVRFSFLSEYAKSVRAINGAYVREHYKCVFKKDAVKSLFRLK